MTILINGLPLLPQPAQSRWKAHIVDGLLNGTEATGAAYIFTISAPKIYGQTFNWQTYENRDLDSLTAYAPGSGPENTAVTYNSGVVSRKIREYKQPDDRTVTGVEMDIMVVI